MKYILIKVTLISVVFTAFIACSSPEKTDAAENGYDSVSTAKASPALPDMEMIDADGKTINLGSFKGKKVFLNLWATWCPPCRAELPSIEALAKKVDKDAAFILLSLDENFEVAKKFAISNNLSLPVYYPTQNLPQLFNVSGIPVTFIFDENGNLLKQNNGAENYDTQQYVDLLSR